LTHIHLIGIGGSGLSAIARVLHESGYTVSGSDRVDTPLAQSLRVSGLKVNIGHNASNISNADLIIRSSAIPEDNPEVQAGHRAGIPVMKRSEFLGQIMSDKDAIAIGGTHGKTTTTAMIAWSLISLDQDPSYIIGGVSRNMHSNAHAGKGQFFVIEADEYDDMFLGLQPKAIIITNIEHDHPDFFKTPTDYYQAFLKFSRTILPEGSIYICMDNPGSASLSKEVPSGISLWTFGIDSHANYIARDILLNNSNCHEYSARYP
jgi:UDP-N-acetylmuramate--alanine ligase